MGSFFPMSRAARVLIIVALLVLSAVAAGCSTASLTPQTASSPSALPVSVSPTAEPSLNPPPPASAVTSTPAGGAGLSGSNAPVSDSPTQLPSQTTPTTGDSRGATAAPVASPIATGTAAPTVVSQPATFSGAAAWEHVRELSASIGSRPSGSSALEDAAKYIRGELESAGLRATLQPYSFSSFQERSVQLTVLQPEAVEIAAHTLLYSGSGVVEGPLVHAGLGRPADFPNQSLAGKIALVERGAGIPFQDKVTNAVARNASAVVIYNNEGAEFRGSLARQAPIPVVGISQFDGQRLVEQLRRGAVSLRLEVDASTDTSQGNNVVATNSTSAGRRKVVIGAHYDSIPAGPGANDNASGVATMIELARSVRGQQYPFDLVFVAFGDEEIGLVGSKRYVESLSAEERKQIVAMINMDMVGVGDQMEFGGDATLANKAIQTARQMGYRASELNPRFGSASDHASFRDVGIPAVFFYRSDDPNYHTRLDEADKVVPAHLEAAGKVALRLLEELRKGA